MPFSYKPLFKLLVDKEMTREDLRVALGFGRNTIAKMGKGEYVSLEVIDKICTHFGVQPNDVIEHVSGTEEKEG
ncbi:helix-turn-helix domain-containing protein [Paenibacillus dendritiformis]|uniref:helix-turn-helix domain-containing protein n=1 Tax=Paenibacillus dendritiformis TaxID=130049 RepID=UPI000DAA56D2|nr:helix-turn-helix transcriptional regulator [Paenibacillus dendritiformis]PZM61861.1 XRE family transcriptional regulator [Paenibacillus dendritiformis]